MYKDKKTIMIILIALLGIVPFTSSFAVKVEFVFINSSGKSWQQMGYYFHHECSGKIKQNDNPTDNNVTVIPSTGKPIPYYLGSSVFPPYKHTCKINGEIVFAVPVEGDACIFTYSVDLNTMEGTASGRIKDGIYPCTAKYVPIGSGPYASPIFHFYFDKPKVKKESKK